MFVLMCSYKVRKKNHLRHRLIPGKADYISHTGLLSFLSYYSVLLSMPSRVKSILEKIALRSITHSCASGLKIAVYAQKLV